jgi:hypothetical protein
MEQMDVRGMIRDALQEFADYKGELAEERKRRENLEHRMNELIEENHRSRARAEEVERGSAIRTELQKLGVAKVDLAFRVVKDDVVRSEDGRLVARTERGEVALRDYLTQFVNENPELLPARMSGGSGATAFTRNQPATPAAVLDVDAIRPGMSAEELDKIRQEISRVASQTMRGL